MLLRGVADSLTSFGKNHGRFSHDFCFERKICFCPIPLQFAKKLEFVEVKKIHFLARILKCGVLRTAEHPFGREEFFFH
jgi:hypothetical protein